MPTHPDRKQVGDSILEVLRAKKGISAKEIAESLEIESRIVKSILLRELKGSVSQDVNGDWWPCGPAAPKPAEKSASNFSEMAELEWVYSSGDGAKSSAARPIEGPAPEQRSLIARLCRYYLSVLSHESLVDDRSGGVVISDDRTEHIELPVLPIDGIDSEDDTSSAVVPKEMLDRLRPRSGTPTRSGDSRMIPVVGYPTLLKHVGAPKGGTQTILQPLLLYELEMTENGSARIVDGRFPLLNFYALRLLTAQEGGAVMNEALSLMAELGMGEVDSSLEPAELPVRLCEARPEWQWIEPVDPYVLGTTPSLSELKMEGIYNRAILYLNARSLYTKGLESELGELYSVSDAPLNKSSLGLLLKDSAAEPDGDLIQSSPDLLEVVPLNTEQRSAVAAALVRPITVITGPPGTGKSQVVTEILVNAAWQGKRVLFASKNNKAVDVVEERVNALAGFPALLRLGSNQAYARLTDQIKSLVSSTISDDDRTRFRSMKSKYDELSKRRTEIDERRRAHIDLRNRVDHLEQELETARDSLGEELFARLRSVDSTTVDETHAALTVALHKATRRRAPLFVRIFWGMFERARMTELTGAVHQVRRIEETVGALVSASEVELNLLESAYALQHALERRLGEIERIQEYDRALKELGETEGLVSLSIREWKLLQELFGVARELWKGWQSLLPDRVAAPTRRKLADYASVLRLMQDDSGEDRRPTHAALAQYCRLSQEISSTLPCWAVTSLSARGRVPFTSGVFDLLVIDEASQCDIASALPLLYRAKSAVIIGDPNQLTHISTIPKAMDRQLLEKYGLLELPRWAYSVNSLFDLASSLVAQNDIITLRDHHRSHADIIEFSNEHFYDGKLRVATKYEHLCSVPNRGHGVVWIEVKGATRRPTEGGAVNSPEASAVVDEALKLLTDTGFNGSLGIVTPFRGQANLIRRMLTARAAHVAESRLSQVVVDTVHKFQGDESDVMILSPTLSQGVTESATRFVQSNRNLLNVAITRARSLLLIVGDRTFASTLPKGSLMRSLSDYAWELENSKREAPQGPNSPTSTFPAVSSPELVSPWEKLFYEAAHTEGLELIPQYSVDQFLLDFALFNGERKLTIEIDGDNYHRDWTGELIARDRLRNLRLMELGWDVMRFWVYEVRDSLGTCITDVRQWAEPN